MSIFEYDEERELALMRKAIASEARKEGIAEGHAEGHAAGRTEGRREGILEGREDEIKSLIGKESPSPRLQMSWRGMRRR